MEVLRRKKKQNAETKEAHKRKEYPVHYTKEEVPEPYQQQRYLTYALSLIKAEEPLYWHILSLRMKGFTVKRLTKYLNDQGYNTTESQLSRKEAEAIRCVKQTIERVKASGIPVFDDPFSPKPKSSLILPDTPAKAPDCNVGHADKPAPKIIRSAT